MKPGTWHVGESPLAIKYIEQLEPELWDKVSEARSKLSYTLGNLTASAQFDGMTAEQCEAMAADVKEALSLLGIDFYRVEEPEPIASRKAEPDA